LLVEGEADVSVLDSCVLDNQVFKTETSQPPKQPVKQEQPLSCPQCGCNRLYRAGLRYYYDGSQTQRWLCRECNYRFSIRPVGTVTLRDLEKRLKTTLKGSVNCQGRDESKDGGARNLLTEGYYLVNSTTRQENAQREGTTQEQAPSDNAGKIVSFLWEMKQNGAKDITLKTWSFQLQKLAKHTDLTPESVKEYLAKTTDWSDATKKSVVTIYGCFLKYCGITWEPPKYKAPDKLHFIPTEAEIDSLIAGSGKVLSAFLQFLKETGARGGEAANTKWKDVDFERKIVHITPEKGSKARILPISNTLIDMLNRLPKNHDEKIFATFSSLRSNFHDIRKGVIFKLQNPRLKDIHLHTFRHWKATMEYHKTKDILHVQQILGHRNIECTMIYITLEKALFQNTSEDYTSRIARTDEELCELVNAGFEYVTDTMGGAKLFRKRK